MAGVRRLTPEEIEREENGPLDWDLMRLPLKWTGPEACRPRRTHSGDAGFDLVVAESAVVKPGEFADVSAGIRIELPPKTWAMVTGRSSTLRRRRLMVNDGVIDNGYRGPLFVAVWNLGKETARIKEGERLGQLIVLPLLALGVTPIRVAEDTLSETDRGEAGFGSTGE